MLGVEWHLFDKAELESTLQTPIEELWGLVVIDASDQYCIDLDRAQACVDCRLNARFHILESISSSDLVKVIRPDRVETDVDAIQACTLQVSGQMLQPQSIGRQGYFNGFVDGLGFLDQPRQPLAQEWFASGEANFSDAKIPDPDPQQTEYLIVGQDLLIGRPVETLGWHAIFTSEIAPVGQGNPEVTGHPAIGINQLLHLSSIGTPVEELVDGLYAQMVSFLFTRRWLLFFIAVGLLAYLAWLLGQWQFHRLDERKQSNSTVARNLAALPVPVADLMTPNRQPEATNEWRQVTVHGSWDDHNTVVLKYQTRDAGAGIDVVTPLITQSGTAVLVNRGWMSTDNTGGTRPKTPKAYSGPVTVTGWVRRDATGAATVVADMSTRAISSIEIGKKLDYPLYQGFLDLKEEAPSPKDALASIELPDDTSEGPHFFYGLQWWFFGALAILGFGYLAYDEWILRRKSMKEVTSAEDADVEDAG